MKLIKKMPIGWKIERLDRVACVQTGLAKNSKQLKEWVELPYLRVANVQDGYLDLSAVKSVKVEPGKVDRYALQHGDVLMTEGGDFDKLGRGAVWYGQVEKCLHQNHVFAVRPDRSKMLSEFLSALTGSYYGKKYFLSCSKQSTNLASINSSQLKAFPILLPPLPEQKAIAAVLSTWDAAIEKTERLVGAKGRRFNWLLRKLISEPCRTAEWESVKLGDVCKIAHKEKLKSVEEHFLLTVKLHCLGIERNGRAIAKLTERGRPYFKHDSGDFLIGRQNFHNGGFGIVSPELDGGITSNAISCLLLNHSKLLKPFLWYQFSNANYYKKIGHIMDGTGQKELSDKQILKLQIVLPNLEEQREIVETLSASKQEIDLQEQLLEKYKTQKRGLMQKLLMGEWRVAHQEIKDNKEVPCG